MFAKHLVDSWWPYGVRFMVALDQEARWSVVLSQYAKQDLSFANTK